VIKGGVTTSATTKAAAPASGSASPTPEPDDRPTTGAWQDGLREETPRRLRTLNPRVFGPHWLNK